MKHVWETIGAASLLWALFRIVFYTNVAQPLIGLLVAVIAAEMSVAVHAEEIAEEMETK